MSRWPRAVPDPLLRALEITPETHGPRGLGYAELPEASARLSRAVRAGRDRRGGPAPSRRAHAGHARAAHQPGHRRAHRARAPPAPAALGLHGRRVPGARQHDAGSEWNVHCDPEAARLVFAAWQAAVDADASTPRALVLGLDVTERARLTTDDVVALARRAGSRPDDTLDPGREPGAPEHRSVAGNPVIRFLADALRFYFEFHATYDGFYGAFIHDPLVVAAALDPAPDHDGARRRRGRRLRRPGRTARRSPTGGGPRAGRRTPTSPSAVDAAEFRRRLVERVGALAASRAGGGRDARDGPARERACRHPADRG